MAASNDGFLDLPQRPGKPRAEGLTHVIDKGLNLRDIEGMFDTAGQFVDIVKLGWGTSYVTNNLEKKIALYRSFETPVVCGGTLFEAVYGRGRMDDFKAGPVEAPVSPAGAGGPPSRRGSSSIVSPTSRSRTAPSRSPATRSSS